MKVTSSYLNFIYVNHTRFRKLIHLTSKRIKKLQKELKFEAIAFTGHSGSGIAYPLWYYTGIPLICVRKNKESSHTGSLIEGGGEYHRYLILDDFISTGETVKTIMQEIDKYSRIHLTQCECVGVFLYAWFTRTPDVYWQKKYQEVLNVPIFVQSINEVI